MTLRMVSGATYPRPVIDVTMGIHTYEAFINMSIENTRISLEVLNQINECKALLNEEPFTINTRVEFPIRRRNHQTNVLLDIQEHQTDPVILGMDFFMNMGFKLVADHVEINERSPVMNCPKSIDYLYNKPQGRDLRTWLQETHQPIHTGYTKEETTEENINHNNNTDAQENAYDSDDILELHASDEDLNLNE